MEIKRIGKMLLQFGDGNEVTDIQLRSKDFSNQEIMNVEKLVYIDCVATTPLGDRVYMINEEGLTFIDTYKNRI